ncbi:MAG: copper ion binding protein [Leptospiraceae bacterium]|nr:heavy-metal-associated domain-containing protein [Leptospiraceae bacterium]MCK6380028.1 copper ion binding protein [Leptospiraceae bacterium]
MKTLELNVNGMSCGHCVNTITKSLKALAGVKEVEVSLLNKKVSVSFEENTVQAEKIKESIVDAGYEVA